jgi:predicted ATP-grasp superfamily ATP-dependent carboligase
VRVLVTNAEERSVIAACRCLHAAGHEVTAVSSSRLAAGHWSRACARRLRLPDPRDDAEGFAGGLEAELRARPYATLLAATDPALLAVARARERLEPLTRLGLPEPAAVERALDRTALLDAARAAGLQSPPTRVCADAREATEYASTLGYPVLLKSRHPVVHAGARVLQSPPARPAAGARELTAMLPRYGTPCLVQAARPGPVWSFAGVAAGGRLLGFAASRYVRTWPPAAGSVAFSETVAVDEDLREATAALVRDIGWQGIFELELVGARDGRFAAIDFNPRPYGSMALASAAGAPLAALWVDWLTGGDPRPVTARPGVRYRWEDADLRNVLWHLRRGRPAEAARILRPRRGVVHPHFRLSDPGPLAARLLKVAADRAARRREASSA